jgi:glyoxylase-like metal-dependent hydrolase (beta-lactamase superfamily II)
MREVPNAKLVVHRRGSEPSRLVAGVTAVYGNEYVDTVYGDILPIFAERIIDAHEGLTVQLGSRELLMIDTPGHAKHHICIIDRRTDAIFTGEMFGLSYHEFDVDGRQFIMPTTSPTQFEPAEMRASIDRLMTYQPRAVNLTHYAQVTELPSQAAYLHRRLNAHVAIAEAHASDGESRHATTKRELSAYFLAELRAHGCALAEATLLDIQASDLELNAQGLTWRLDHRVRSEECRVLILARQRLTRKAYSQPWCIGVFKIGIRPGADGWYASNSIFIQPVFEEWRWNK